MPVSPPTTESVTSIREELRARADASPAHQAILIETESAFEGVLIAESGELNLTEDGSIPDVAVLRENSRNQRNYKAVMNEKTARIFEGATVYLNHPEPGKQHRVEEICGKLSGVYVAKTAGGEAMLRAKKLTPIGAGKTALIETVKSAHDRAGLSIEAVGVGTVDTKTGRLQVTEITKAFGVGLVANPGSTNNLFESVISDKIETDERLEGLRKIISAANSMLSDLIYSYGESKNLSLEQRLTKSKTIATALVAELADFKTSKKVDAKEQDDMTQDEIKKLTVKELREGAPELVSAILTEDTAKLKTQLDEANAKIQKLEEGIAASQRAESFRKTAQTLFEKVCKAKAVPQRLITPRLIRTCVEADFRRFQVEDKIDEAALEAFITEEIEDRMAIAPPTAPSTGPRIMESAPFQGLDDGKPISESMSGDDLQKVVFAGR